MNIIDEDGEWHPASLSEHVLILSFLAVGCVVLYAFLALFGVVPWWG